jgi:hypothetical protein
MYVFNPSYGLSIAYFAKVPLGGRKRAVAENDFGHDLQRGPCPAGIGRCMPPLAINSSISRSLALLVLNMISSTVSFSRIVH